MRVLDTNVPARFFVDDADDAQAARQRPAAIAALAERSFVSVTVLLELEWVMRGFYELPARDVSRVFRALASNEHIALEERDSVLEAIDASDQGLDFADALHLSRSTRVSGFATFDQRLAKRAKALALRPSPKPKARECGKRRLGPCSAKNSNRVAASDEPPALMDAGIQAKAHQSA